MDKQSWIGYISTETSKRWKSKKDGNYSWDRVFKLDFFKIDVTAEEPMDLDNDDDEILRSEPEQPDDLELNDLDLEAPVMPQNDEDLGENIDLEPEQPIDMTDIPKGGKFTFYHCPGRNCDFMDQDRITFKEHIIKNHPYVKGERLDLHFHTFST